MQAIYVLFVFSCATEKQKTKTRTSTALCNGQAVLWEITPSMTSVKLNFCNQTSTTDLYHIRPAQSCTFTEAAIVARKIKGTWGVGMGKGGVLTLRHGGWVESSRRERGLRSSEVGDAFQSGSTCSPRVRQQDSWRHLG